MDTVITFQAPTVTLYAGVTSQYHADGIDFGWPPYGALPASSQIPGGVQGTVPIIVAAPANYPAAQVAKLITPTEFTSAEAFGIFAGFHQHVKATVGSFFPENNNVTLTAYDINGVLVASATASIASGRPPAVLQAVSLSATPNIAYFLIVCSEASVPLWIGQVSFDAGATQADFNWLTTPLVYVTQATAVTQLLTLTRFGGSSGDIQFAATGLPAHVTASFSPNPASGAADTTNLTISAAANAGGVVNAPFKISATPASAAVGPEVRTATGQLNVLLPFQLLLPGPITISVLPCTPVGLMGYITINPGFVGTITFSIDGLPANASYTITPTSASSAQSSLTVLYVSILVSGGLGMAIPITVTARSGSLTSSIALTIQPQGASITNVPPSAKAPVALQPGTTINITGTGFCPGSTVRFGNDAAISTPTSITPTEIQVTVPRYATTGLAANVPFPFGVIPPSGTDSDLIPAPSLCFIDSFRNSVGLPFENFKYGTVTIGQIEALFGNSGGAAALFAAAAQAFVSTGSGDVCFGMCLTTQRMYQDNTAALAASFPPNRPIAAFGLNSPDDNGGPSAALQDYIRSQYLAQLSNEYLSAYLTYAVNNTNPSSGALRQAIAGCLQRTLPNGSDPIPYPDYPLIAMRQGLGSGHVVVAYDIQDGTNGDFDVLVYDPNDPFTSLASVADSQSGEDLDGTGAAHQSIVDHCTIHITGDGQWTYAPQDDSGSIDELVPVSSTVIPLRPTMLGTTADLVVAGSTIALAAFGAEFGSAFGPLGTLIGGVIGAVAGLIRGLLEDLGSLVHLHLFKARSGSPGGLAREAASMLIKTVQLSNHDGRTLFGPDGRGNRDPKWRLAAAPFAPPGGSPNAGEMFIVTKGDRYQHAVKGIGTGTYGMILLGGTFIAVVTTNTTPGQNDEFTLDTRDGTVGFRTDAERAPLMVEILVQRPDGSVRLAAFATTTSVRAMETVHFNLDCSAVTLEHRGPEAICVLALAAIDGEGRVATFNSGLRPLADGRTATFGPIDWGSLDRIVLTESAPMMASILTANPVPGAPGMLVH